MPLLGILVIGDNHFIVEGPEPDAAQALTLARQWSLIRIGGNTTSIPGWTMRTKAFREDLQWAVILAEDRPHSPAVTILLDELTQRGIRLQRYPRSIASAEIGLP